eukprot:658123-Rhodomonas_salina.4
MALDVRRMSIKIREDPSYVSAGHRIAKAIVSVPDIASDMRDASIGQSIGHLVGRMQYRK